MLGETYSGRHGLSRRLIGLDPTNSNAQERGLVIHAADYVSDELAKSTGKIGRSEGCLAVSPADLKLVLDQLGPRCLIYADRI
ncbi:murein L,D-transpeptidase catalytic domain-containing protein [uncultured Sphingomonas sp.]|uniref:murein L,D-transpeptidase catalytic domain-containing protein n=1 Tax=uncultured Sphingomonas sp. TaxID=158754 RepID=UPI0025DD29B6|nr:murein L,D-transpeptidase catalytic domain family protein [uncultured Sphingomonas sp.]